MKTKISRKEYQKLWAKKNRKSVNARARAWAKLHPKKIRLIHQKYFKKNKKVFRLRLMNWRKRHKEHAKKTRQKWYAKNRRKLILRMRRWKKHWRQTPAGKFYLYQKMAERRGIGFYLSFKQFMAFWQRPCHYCKRAIKTIGLDRKNNKQGYLVANVVPCCTACNNLKREWGYKNFLRQVRRIAKCFNGKG